MSPVFLFAGVIAALLAMLLVVFFVLFPSTPRVSKARRSAPGEHDDSVLTRLTDRTTSAIGAATRGREGSFGPDRLEQAGIKMESSGFMLMIVAAAAVLALIGAVIGFGSWWSIPLALIFVAVAPIGAKILVVWRTGQRRSKFGFQLDDTLQLISGGLRAGHSLLRSIDAVSRETDAPTSEEFTRVVNETRLGRDLSDALAITAERMQSDDFMWVAQAIAINREAGGNLSEVLDQVASTIRERNQIRRQVSALSAEGRLSGIILILLPIGVFLFLLWTQPEYFVPLFTNLIGILALILAVILLIIGSIWMLLTVRVKF